MSQVIPFEQKKGGAFCPADGPELMDFLRKDLYGVDLVALANRVGVSPSALYSIRAGRTKWPRHTTLFCLVTALGYQIYIRRV